MRELHDLKTWREGMSLAQEVYRYVEGFRGDEDPGLARDMRIAAVSVPSKVAAGFALLEPDGLRENLELARRSAIELAVMIEVAIGLEYGAEKEGRALLARAEGLVQMLSGFLDSMEREAILEWHEDDALEPCW